MQAPSSTNFYPADLGCPVGVKKQQRTGERPIVARAFGDYLRDRRIAVGEGGWSQEDVADLVTPKVTGPTISHLEQGKVAAPDPVLLKELAKLYGVDLTGLVDLLKRSRSAPTALIHELKAASPEEADMVVRGVEEHFVKEFRKLSAKAAFGARIWRVRLVWWSRETSHSTISVGCVKY